jgi:hypothetical protein
MAQMTLKETVPSPLVLRDMLEEMAVKELQGPAQGDEEEVSERIRDRYLVGILAPRQRAEDMPLPLFEKPAAPPAEDDDVLEGDFPPGEELGIEGVGRGNLSGDDGPTELSAPMSKAVYPSSLGLSFCVPLETTTLKVRPAGDTTTRTPASSWSIPRPERPSGSGSTDPAEAFSTRFPSRRGRSDPSSPTSHSPTPRSRDSSAAALTTGASRSSLSTTASSRRPQTGSGHGCSSARWRSRHLTAPPSSRSGSAASTSPAPTGVQARERHAGDALPSPRRVRRGAQHRRPR